MDIVVVRKQPPLNLPCLCKQPTISAGKCTVCGKAKR